MKIFFDTEFLDHGKEVELVSLGAIRQDGERFYMENAECDLSRANEWVRKNVIPKLTGPTRTLNHIREKFVEFVGNDPEFWAYYGTYDWWLICQLYGGFMQLPRQWPNYYNELMTLAILRGYRDVYAFPNIPKAFNEHHAIYDAEWNRAVYNKFMYEV